MRHRENFYNENSGGHLRFLTSEVIFLSLVQLLGSCHVPCPLPCPQIPSVLLSSFFLILSPLSGSQAEDVSRSKFPRSDLPLQRENRSVVRGSLSLVVLPIKLLSR